MGSACPRLLRVESAAFTDEPNAKADERPEDRGPRAHVPRPRHAQQDQTAVARERPDERHEPEEADDRAEAFEARLACPVRRDLALLSWERPARPRRRGATALSAARHTEARSGPGPRHPASRAPRSTHRSRSASRR